MFPVSQSAGWPSRLETTVPGVDDTEGSDQTAHPVVAQEPPQLRGLLSPRAPCVVFICQPTSFPASKDPKRLTLSATHAPDSAMAPTWCLPGGGVLGAPLPLHIVCWAQRAPKSQEKKQTPLQSSPQPQNEGCPGAGTVEGLPPSLLCLPQS